MIDRGRRRKLETLRAAGEYIPHCRKGARRAGWQAAMQALIPCGRRRPDDVPPDRRHASANDTTSEFNPGN